MPSPIASAPDRTCWCVSASQKNGNAYSAGTPRRNRVHRRRPSGGQDREARQGMNSAAALMSTPSAPSPGQVQHVVT